MENTLESIEKTKRKTPKAVCVILCALAALLLSAVLFAAACLIHREEGSSAFAVRENDDVLPLQAGEYSDIGRLRQEAGFPLVTLQGSFLGEARNMIWNGKPARWIRLTYNSDITITAVTPADAAPLIRMDGMELSLRTDAAVLGMPATVAVSRNGTCVYFRSGQAAYALFAPGAGEEETLKLCRELDGTAVK